MKIDEWTPDALLQMCQSFSTPRERNLAAAIERRDAEIARLRALIDTPHIDNFLEAVRVEAAHQCERWGIANNQGKSPADWFWLLGWLAGKAVHAATRGDTEKALHHTISSAAVLLNWHAHMSGERTRMRPGIAESNDAGAP